MDNKTRLRLLDSMPMSKNDSKKKLSWEKIYPYRSPP